MGIDRNIKTPYVTTWTVNIEHSFTPNLVLEIAYVANHGSRLVGIRDINQVNPALDNGTEQFGRPFTYNCPVSEGGAGAGGPCFPYLAQVFQMGNIYRSNYDGLQTTLTSRNYHGLSMIAGLHVVALARPGRCQLGLRRRPWPSQ